MKSKELKKSGGLRRNCRKIISLILTLGILAMLTLTMAAPALATTYEEHYINADTESSLNGDHWEAQTFTTTGTHPVRSIEMLLWRDPGYTGTFTLSLRATENGVPTGEDLCSFTHEASYVEEYVPTETLAGWLRVPIFDSEAFNRDTYPLSANTIYAIVLRADYCPDGDLHWRYDSNGGYNEGTRCSSSDGGTSWTSVDGDCMFQIWSWDPGMLILPRSEKITTEGGGTVIFDVRLTSQPAADVTVWFTSSDPTEGTISPSSFTFTRDNWGIPQVMNVIGVDDSVIDGDIEYTITTGPVISEDIGYVDMMTYRIPFINLDDGEPAPNVPPVAADDNAATNEDTSVIIDVVDNDTDADGGTIIVTWVGQPANGILTYNSGGLFSDITYTPNLNFNGTDSFTYSIGDMQGGTDTATVTINLNP